MAVAQYTQLATKTLASNAATVTFSSIPYTYRDLMLVCYVKLVNGSDYATLRFNSDSSSSYPSVTAWGSSQAYISDTRIYLRVQGYTPVNSYLTSIVNIMDYSATDKQKSLIIRANTNDTISELGVEMQVAKWPSTSSVNSLTINAYSGGNLAAGSTFSLYGVK